MARSQHSSSRSAPAGSGPRWGRIALLVGGIVVVLALAGGVAWGAYAWATRTATITITVHPADARITVTTVGGVGVRGTSWKGSARLVVSPAKAGGYSATVEAPGYVTQGIPFSLKAGDQYSRDFNLVAAPVALSLAVYPKTATWTLSGPNGSRTTGTGPWTKPMPIGRYSLAVSSKGAAPYKRDFELALGSQPTVISATLDPSGQLVRKIAVFKCVPAPKGVAITPDGKQVWVTALVTQPSIASYDPYTGKQLGSADLGKDGAVEVVFNKDGSRAYASQMQSASVYEIDTKTMKVLRRFSTGSSWTKIVELSPDQTKVYAANWSGDDVSIIDLRTGKLRKRIPTVDTPRGLYPTSDGKRLFVAGFGENSFVGNLAVIDLATGKSKTFFSKRGSAMRHMVADEKRGIIFTSDMGKGVIWTTDMTTLKTTKFVDTDSHPNTIALTPDGKVLVVSNRGANNPKSYYIPGPEWGSILLFDAHTGKALDAIIGGNQCTALALSKDGKLLVFSDFLDNRLRSYEIPAYDVLAGGNGGRFPAHLKDIQKKGWASYFTDHAPGSSAGSSGN